MAAFDNIIFGDRNEICYLQSPKAINPAQLIG